MQLTIGAPKSVDSSQEHPEDALSSFDETPDKTTSFSIKVETVPSEKYVHIELGAGNLLGVYQEPRRPQHNFPLQFKDIHKENCECDGCNYSLNKHRYQILSSTISDIRKRHPFADVTLVLNDFDYVSLNQAYKFSCQYIDENKLGGLHQFTVTQLPGNYYQTKFNHLKPNSVHLKNHELEFLTIIKKYFDTTVLLLCEQSKGCDAGGFLITTPNPTQLRAVFEDRQINPYGVTLTPYPLNFDTKYHLPIFDELLETQWFQTSATFLCSSKTNITPLTRSLPEPWQTEGDTESSSKQGSLNKKAAATYPETRMMV